jgi:hypothetical protein
MSDEAIEVLIGDDEIVDDSDARVRAFDQVLYPGTIDSFEHGPDSVGSARGFFVVTPRGGMAICHLTLEIEEYGSRKAGTLNAGGVLSHDDGIREGVLSVAGGRGRFRGSILQVRVDTLNPKRYIIEPGG